MVHPMTYSLLRAYAITFAVLGTGAYIGWSLDRLEDRRMIKFRDKSALYGRTLAPGEPPSWP